MSDNKPHPQLRLLLLSIILVAFFFIAGSSAFRFLASLRKPPERAEFTRPSAAVKVLLAQSGDYREKLFGYGVAREMRATEVEAELSAIVRWVSPKLEAGLQVQDKEELVRLDERDFQQALVTAEATLAQARIAVEALKLDLATTQKQLSVLRRELAVAARELARIQDLERNKQVAASALDSQILQTSVRERAVIDLEWQEASRKSSLERAEAEITLRQAQLVKAQNDMARTVIVAPYSGQIERRLVQQGARVGPGKQLFRIVDIGRVEVAVSLGASYFGEVNTDSPVWLRRQEDGDIAWHGKISRISPTVSQSERTFSVYAEVANASLAPGTFVCAEVEGKLHKDVIAIPRAAFIGDKVFIVRRQGDAANALVEERTPTIYRALADIVLVRGGIEPGQEVVLTGVDQIGHGSRVHVMGDSRDTR